MSVAVFKAHAEKDVYQAFAALPLFAKELGRLITTGRSAWPELASAVEDDAFVRFLARHLPREAASSDELSSLRAEELYLVCAYALGIRAAHEILEAQYMTRVHTALLRLNTDAATIADIEQELRRRLSEMADPSVARRGYVGRSDLAAWLCLSGIREAGARKKREVRERPLEQAHVEVLPDPERSPELKVLSQRYRAAFKAAFRSAVEELTSRERNLLRYHYLSKLNIDQIGQIYHVHRATAARWISRAEARLTTRTRELLLARVPADSDAMAQINSLIESQLSLSLVRVLRPTAETESAA